MRRIQITESQLVYCLEHMVNEAVNQGAGVTVAAKTDANGKVTKQTLDQQNHELDTQGLQNADILVKQQTLEEKCQVYTKRQLKEARRQKLVAESRKTTKKKIDRSVSRKK